LQTDVTSYIPSELFTAMEPRSDRFMHSIFAKQNETLVNMDHFLYYKTG